MSSSSTKVALECSRLKKSFHSFELLKNITFQVEEGERVSLVGPGGSGKTTILKLLMGLIPPTEGQARILNQFLWQIPTEDRKETLSQVGVAFQQGGFFDFMTVRENLEFAMSHMTDFSQEEQNRRVAKYLNAVKLPKSADKFPYELSGGMQRRIGIARALCIDPLVAIFDEPTSGLDPVTSTIILNMIMELTKESPKSTLMVATSNVEIAIRFAKRIILIHDGEVIADGLWHDLLVSGDPWVKHFLGTRFIGLDLAYAKELNLPEAFLREHW